MVRILGDLTVTLNKDGKGWKLTEPLEYHVGWADSPEVVIVPKDVSTDFASVPAVGRWLVSTWQQMARASVVHDYLYSEDGRQAFGYSRNQADAMFFEILSVMEMKTRLFAWAGVRAFGWMGHRDWGVVKVTETRVQPPNVTTLMFLFLIGMSMIGVGGVFGFSFIKSMWTWSTWSASMGGLVGLATIILGGLFLSAVIMGLGKVSDQKFVPPKRKN